ncbi:MAG: Heme/hemopexin-binding protein precursor, partial [Pseudomonadota bacterium]
MNALCYKTVFSKRLGALVAVGEHATSQSKGQGAASGVGHLGFVLRYVGVLTAGFVAASMAWSQTLPQGGRVSQGKVTIQQTGQNMAITQSTGKAVVNWDSFDIGTNAKVSIVQPSSESVLLNRVLSDNPSQILGQLQANGQVVLVNPKGIVVGSDGSVSASAFTASTLNISDADFMAGNARYHREGSTGEVVNRGRIQTAPGGYVALLGARVSNEGQIIAPQGAVALGAAETVSVPIGRTGKIKLELSPASINTAVVNQKGGLIVAEGGQVYMQAAAIPSALASIVHSGHIDTSAAQAGEVHLLADGGHIRVEGQITANSSGQDPENRPRPGGDIYIGRDKDTHKLAAVGDVSGAQLESKGGFVETSGQHLITTGTRVTAKDWLLDPTEIKIVASNTATPDTRTVTSGGTLTAQDNTGILTSEVLKSTVETAINNGTNVTISTANPTAGADGSGNITIETPLSFNNTGAQAATFRLFAVNGVIQNTGASISATGTQAVNIELVGEGRYLGVAASNANSRGVDLNSTVSTNGNITITGTSRNTGSGFNAVYITNSITSTAGQIQITGTATDSGGGSGAVIQGTVTASGNVSLDGRSANTSNRQGLVVQNTVSSTQGNIQVVGQTAASAQRAVAITLNGTTAGKLQVSNGQTIDIQANTLLINTGSIVDAGSTGTVNIKTLTSGNEIQPGADDTQTSSLSTQKLGIDKAEFDRISAGQVNIGDITSTGAINVTAATTTLASTGNLNLRTGGTISVNQALTVGANLTMQTNGGKIANSATVSGVNVSIDNTNGTINTATGAITAGSANSGSVAAIEASGNITASGNLNLMGVSSNYAGIQVNNQALSGANIQATGRVNNGGYGVLLNAGSSISATGSSGASLVKGINTNGGSNAVITGAGVSFNAATGSTFTVWGDGTNTGDRAVRINGGASTSGTVTIKGTSNNNGGLLVINGPIRASANSALTLEGSTSSAGLTGVYLVNSGGVEMGNGTTLQITGENTATTGTGRGVLVQGLGVFKASGATTAGDVSITGSAASTAAATGLGLESAVNTDGNITLHGSAGAAAGTGVSISSAISSSGTAKSISVTSNQGISHTGSLNVTGNNGTGSTIELTSTLSSLTGTGTMGTTTFKNTSVSVTQAGTSTFSGAVNAANFTKAGTGTLTLDSWTATSPATTNISNAYTVSSGGLTLNTSVSYPALNPASVNVVNNATFSLGSAGNGVWKNTAFNFTGGLGGGTMNLQGNPIGDVNTTNTFSTSGGATNTVNGGLNANNATVNFSLAAATSGTTLHDGTIASLVFPSNSQGGFGLSNATTLNINGSGGVLFKDKLSATQINVNAGTLQMGDGTAATSATTADLTASQVAVASNAKVIFQRAEAVTSSTVFSGSGGLQQAGAGTLTLTGNSSAFAGTTTVHDSRNLAIGTGGSLGAAGSSLVLSNASANVAFTNTSGTSTIGSTISGAGSLSKSGAGTGVITADNSYSGATTVTGGTLQVGNAGSTGTLGSGNVTLSNNATLHVLRAADTTLSNTISGAGHVSASITGTGSDLSITGSVSLTGGTVNLAADGNLSVQQAIGTTNTTDSAIVLTAGKPTNAGTSSGGDVSMSGSGSLSTGAGGRATIYTGSLSGSTGLNITTGNNRYNSDESSTNYSAALGSGTYAIYREKPTITVLVNDASKTYDGLAFNGGSLNTTLSSGALVRSDSFSAVTASSTLGGAAQGEKNAGQYAITASDSGGKNALGYGVTYTSGQLTIHQADLTVTANSVSKTYDGTTSASGTGTVGTLAGAAAGDVVNSSGSQAFLTSGAGNNKTVRASGVTIKDSANADMTGNYNINYTDNNT